jgi:hypothetical protein
MFPLGMVSVGSAGASSIVFDNIPNTYKHLQLRCFLKTSADSDLEMRFNTDTASATNYRTHILRGLGTNAQAESYAISVPTNLRSASFAVTIIDILDYASSTKTKTSRSLTGNDNNTTGEVGLWSNLWFATPAAITKITHTLSTGTFSQYSQIALYGIKGA